MIEIDSTLLSATALDNLLIEVITRQATEYGDIEMDIELKKKQLRDHIKRKLAVIVYSEEDEICDIIPIDEYIKFKRNIK